MNHLSDLQTRDQGSNMPDGVGTLFLDRDDDFRLQVAPTDDSIGDTEFHMDWNGQQTFQNASVLQSDLTSPQLVPDLFDLPSQAVNPSYSNTSTHLLSSLIGDTNGEQPYQQPNYHPTQSYYYVQAQPTALASFAQEEYDSLVNQLILYDNSAATQESTRESSSQPDSQNGDKLWFDSPQELLAQMKITKCKGGQKGSAQWPIACHRCRNQRIKCVRDPEKYGINGPCVACCALPNGNSTKIEHWFPCITFGYKLHHIITYRAGNLGLTARFDHHKMANVPAVNPQEVFTIRITQRLCAKPMVLEVHYFQPADSDKLDREFVANGVRQVQKLPPVCLHDVTEASKVFVKYVTENALEAIRLAAQDDDSDDIIKEIFAMILFHLESLPRDEKERGFLEKAIFHWFAIRLGLGSAKICGPQTLNITPVSGYMPKHGLLSVPRMIIAQFDSIRHQTVYTKLDREVLMDLERALLSGGKTQWFTVFLAMFLFLNIVSCSSRDRYRYVRENSQGQPLDTRYGKVGDPNTEYVEDLHYGAAMLLAHWDYFKRVDFASMTGKGLDPLEPYQHNFINYLSVRLQQRIDTIPRSPLDGFWESDLAWVLRIFSPKTRKDDVWLPPPIFSQVKLSAGELDEVGLDQRNDFVF